MKTWAEDDITKLIGWLEEHQEHLRGSKAIWTAMASKELFPHSSDMKPIKIKRKYYNMKAQWVKAKKIQHQSGIEVNEENCEPAINGNILPKTSIHPLPNLYGLMPTY